MVRVTCLQDLSYAPAGGSAAEVGRRVSVMLYNLRGMPANLVRLRLRRSWTSFTAPHREDLLRWRRAALIMHAALLRDEVSCLPDDP